MLQFLPPYFMTLKRGTESVLLLLRRHIQQFLDPLNRQLIQQAKPVDAMLHVLSVKISSNCGKATIVLYQLYKMASSNNHWTNQLYTTDFRWNSGVSHDPTRLLKVNICSAPANATSSMSTK
jgi:hypothetical protein